MPYDKSKICARPLCIENYKMLREIKVPNK